MSIQTTHERAEAAMENGKWQKAVQLYSQAIQENPEDHTLLAGRARAVLNMGPQMAPFASQDAKRSCMMEPTYMDGYLLFSKCKLVEGHLWMAEIGVRKGLLIAPENADLIEQLERVQEARNNPSQVVRIVPIYDAPDTLGFVYTHGLVWKGIPELLMVDVPSGLMSLAVELIGTVAIGLEKGTMDLSHGDTINIDGDRLQALCVSEDENRIAMINICGYLNEHCELIVLKLLDEENPLESRDRETSIPAAPDGNENRLKSILDKWRDVSSFTFFVDGDEENENAYNRMEVPLSLVLMKRTMQSNWDETFTRQEGQYTWDNWDAICHHARADLLNVGYALDGQYIRNIARHCQSPTIIQSRYQQGVKMATEH